MPKTASFFSAMYDIFFPKCVAFEGGAPLLNPKCVILPIAMVWYVCMWCVCVCVLIVYVCMCMVCMCVCVWCVCMWCVCVCVLIEPSLIRAFKRFKRILFNTFCTYYLHYFANPFILFNSQRHYYLPLKFAHLGLFLQMFFSVFEKKCCWKDLFWMAGVRLKKKNQFSRSFYQCYCIFTIDIFISILPILHTDPAGVLFKIRKEWVYYILCANSLWELNLNGPFVLPPLFYQ